MAMKKIYALLLLLGFTAICCSSAQDASITVKSLASENVYLNVLGKTITVAPGKTVVINDITAGTYEYQTTYAVPSGVSGTTVEGTPSGSFKITAGTKVNIMYTSRIQSTSAGGSSASQSSYILTVSISSSDPVTSTTGS
jgi:hypothetical protein